MTRKEYIKYVQSKKLNKPKQCVVKDKSVTDPSFAQTGRQMLTNPLPIEYRMKYPAGVPLDKENPLNFKEYDKLYPDTFKAIRDAKDVTAQTETKLGEIQQGLIDKNKLTQ